MHVQMTAEREPTADERAGIAWWNSRSEHARAYWLKRANTAVPADAWAAYQSAAKLHDDKAYRALDGIRIDGQDLCVTVTAMTDGLLHVLVDANAGATGYGSACRLTGEASATAFPIEGIRVDAGEMQCFAPCRSFPMFQEGFKVPLEPHMIEQLRNWLPRLAKSAALARFMADSVRQALPEEKPIAHMEGFISEFAALMVLDDQLPDVALALLSSTHWAAKDEEFVAAVRAVASPPPWTGAAGTK